jgi:hypothetical protein
VTTLTGTGRCADDLYLLAHHDVTGKSFLQPRALGIGLAGALLAELALVGAVRVTDGQVLPDGLADPGDALTRRVLAVLRAEPGCLPASDLLAFLSGFVEQHVAARLAGAGYLTRVRSRRPWRDGRWVPADPDSAFAPVGRIRAVLNPTRRAIAADVVLAGLAVGCGLGSRLLPYGPPGAIRHLNDAISRLSPDLRDLIAQVQAVTDAAVLSHHG